MPFFNYKKEYHHPNKEIGEITYIEKCLIYIQGKQLQTWLVNIHATLKFIEEVHKFR